MARQESLNILLENSGKMLLAEEYKGVIENLQSILVSSTIKNQDLSGDPTGGSVEAKRFANAVPQEYGTARTAGKGNSVKGTAVTINISNDREIVEEVEEKDAMLLGVEGLIQRRVANHPLQMANELDTAFFAEAVSAGTTYTPASGITDIQDVIENAIVTVESTKNNYVNGVPRQLISVTCSPDVYSQMRKFFDISTSNTTYDVSNAEIPTYHGARVFMSLNLPTGTDFVVQVDGSIAQPVLMPDEYEVEKVGLSKSYAIELFYSFGTKAVTPDLILVKKSA
jgi:hypothetical protein